ncbi:MAG: hypothetical protein WC378_10580 [Opitutaceae bacterium]|jgi:hypothetical protein
MKQIYRVGFALRALNESGVLPAEAFLAPLEVRCFVVETDSGLACWVVYDLTAMSIGHSTAIRTAVASALGCGRDAVVVHCTHTHSVPDHFFAFPVEVLAGQAVAAAREAQARLQPFRLVEATADVGNRFSVLRRKFLPGIGTFTVWYGYRLENGRPDGAPLIREQAERMFGQRYTQIPEFADPIWFDDQIDPLAQGLVFVGSDGKAIGSLIRFSAHPHTTSHVQELRYHPDFPGFARSAVEREFGGMCIYLTGPCGDIVPKEEMQFRMPPAAERPAGTERNFGPSYWHKEAVPGETLRVAQNIGENLASIILARLKGTPGRKSKGAQASTESRSWATAPRHPSVVRMRTVNLTVPIRENYAASSAAAKSAQDAETERLRELQQGEGTNRATPWEIRSLADRVQQLGHEALDIRTLPAGALQSRQVTLEMGLLQLGDIILAGLPSEPLVGTSHRLRANTLGERLWTVTLVNGWIGYMPGSFDCVAGGYESARTPLPPNGLVQYDTQACNAIREMMG